MASAVIRLLVDSGPLAGFLNARDVWHAWSVTTFRNVDDVLYTCDAVLAETCHLVKASAVAVDRLMDMVESEIIVVLPIFPNEVVAVRALLQKYGPDRMDLADACLVRMSELYPDCRVITTDIMDFRIYRRNGRQAIPLICPS